MGFKSEGSYFLIMSTVTFASQIMARILLDAYVLRMGRIEKQFIMVGYSLKHHIFILYIVWTHGNFLCIKLFTIYKVTLNNKNN